LLAGNGPVTNLAIPTRQNFFRLPKDTANPIGAFSRIIQGPLVGSKSTDESKQANPMNARSEPTIEPNYNGLPTSTRVKTYNSSNAA